MPIQEPPPVPIKERSPLLWIIFTFSGASLVMLIVALIAYHSIIATGITRTFDNEFGDQHLKTAVALIELHKLRYGKYPDSLRDLKFRGQWDQLALNSVYYRPSPNRDAYYIEVERGWMGKPTFTMPPEFWKGTGYSPAVKPTIDENKK